MTDFIVNQPLQDRQVYGIEQNGSKVLIGHITCVTPEDWVMYFSDARWQCVSCVECFPSSESGTMRDCEECVYGLLVPVAA